MAVPGKTLLPEPGRTARRIRRYPVGVPVRLTWDGAERHGTSLDLSANAIRIQCAGSALPERTAVQVELEIPRCPAPVRLPGVVVRSTAEDLVVQFSDPPEVLLSFLRNIVVAYFPDTIQATRLRMSTEVRSRRAAMTRPRSGNKISIVVPLYNESSMVAIFHAALNKLLAEQDFPYEIVYVDDGSRDDTLTILGGLIDAADHSVQIVSLARNFGHQAALFAGLEVCTGAAVITMDGDLQHPPELIPTLVAEWRKGFDVVSTIRAGDVNVGAVKRVTSDAFYSVFDWLTGLKLPRGTADFRLLDGLVVDEIIAFPERHIFLRGLAHWVGFTRTYVEYTAPPRAAGVTKFTMRKMLNLASDGIFSFSVFPLRLVFFIGLSMLAMMLGVVVYALQAYLRGVAVPGWSSSLIIASLFSGVELLVLGVIAEYIGRIFTEIKHRPRYLTRAIQSDVEEPVLAALSELLPPSGARLPSPSV